jgi:hypothetical protein
VVIFSRQHEGAEQVLDTKELSDRAEISDVAARMAWCQDRRDWAGLDDVLADELDVEYPPDAGGRLESVSRAQLVAGWLDALERVDASQHVLSGLQIAVDGDDATVKLNELVWLSRSQSMGSHLYSFGTAMELTMRRFEVGWRIVALTVRASWSDGNSAVLGGYDVTRQSQ